jgi:hypothetical protein
MKNVNPVQVSEGIQHAMTFTLIAMPIGAIGLLLILFGLIGRRHQSGEG